MKKGTAYEKLSTEVVSALNTGKKVQHDVRVLGKLSDINRQIDVRLDETDFDFVMYECKDWGKPIGVGVVGQLITDLEDTGAKRGAIISNSRFTKGAKNMAIKKNVTLLHLVKSDDPIAKIGISVMTLVTLHVIDQYGLTIEGDSSSTPYLSLDGDELKLNMDGEIVSALQLLKKRWNEGLNLEARTGEHVLNIPNAHVIDVNGNEHVVKNVGIRYVVGEKYYEGPWLVEEAKGLYNVLDDSFHAYGDMKSSMMKLEDMQKNFMEVPMEQLQKHKYSIRLTIASKLSS